MVIITKKRIKIILTCVLISLCAFAVQNPNKENIKNNNTVMETTATPASGKTIILDAGHRNAR